MSGNPQRPTAAPGPGPRRRRRTGPSPVEPSPERPSFRDGRTWVSIGVVAVLVALVALSGLGMAAAVRPQPSGAFSRCQGAPELAPRTYSAPPPMCIDVKRNYTASIETTKGSVSFVMPAGQAPKTVNNFVVLAVNGYYNGLSFWRIEDWVVQAGDPRGNGRGGPGYSLPEEATAKEWVPGSVGMARPVGGPVNGSQFFITKDKWPGDGPGSTVYNHFGTVVVGFDILQQLTPEDRILKVEVKAG